MKGPIYLALALVALTLFGCGGGKSTSGDASTPKAKAAASTESQAAESSESSAAPSKAVFIKEADAICAKTDKVQKAMLGRYFKAHPKARGSQTGLREAVVVAGIGPIREEAQELRELTPPAGDEQEIAVMNEGIEAALKAAEASPITALTGSLNPFNGVDELARKYGFKACSSVL